MNSEVADNVSDTIGFLLARVRSDTDAAKAIIAGDPDCIIHLLFGMTDLAYAMTMVMAPMVGSTPEELVRTMALGAKFMGAGK